MAFCTNCGNEINEGMKFCTSCGTPVSANLPPEQPSNSNKPDNELTAEGRKIIKSGPKSIPQKPASPKQSPRKTTAVKSTKKETAEKRPTVKKQAAKKPVQLKASKGKTPKRAPKKKSQKKKEISSVWFFFRTLLILASIVLGAALIIVILNVVFTGNSEKEIPKTQKELSKDHNALTGTDIPGIVDIEPEKVATSSSTGKKENNKTIPDVNDENRADKYQYGIDVDNNQYQAFELYKKLADKGDLDAMVHLSDYYEQGIWVRKDSKKARTLLQQAAGKGSLAAKWQLEYLDSSNN